MTFPQNPKKRGREPDDHSSEVTDDESIDQEVGDIGEMLNETVGSDISVFAGESNVSHEQTMPSSSSDLSTFVDYHLKSSELLMNHSELDLEGEDSRMPEPEVSDEEGDTEDQTTVAVDLKVNEHLKATEFLYRDKFNDTGASGEFNLMSEPDNDINIKFNSEDFLNEQLGVLIHHQDDTSTDANGTFAGGVLIDQDESTRDCGELPHISSTPFKEGCCSTISFSEIHELIAEIPPIGLDESCVNNSSESSDSSQEESSNLMEEESSSSDSDVSGGRILFSESFSELLMNRNLNVSEVSDSLENIQNEPNYALSKSCILNNVKIHSDSDLSVNEGILEIMDLYLKNKLSKAGLCRTIRVMCKFLPESHNLPTSSSAILDYVESLAPPVSATVHYYCSSCSYYHGVNIDGICVICKVETRFNHFYIFDMAALIKFFFESRNLASIFDSESEKRINVDPTVLRDLRDGSEYKFINRNKRNYDINIILNSDGIRIRKGSKKELWLAMFTIAELPINLQKSFLTVVGVWYDSKKPDMRTFLKPFAESMESLDQTGVEWIHPTTKEVHTSCVRLLVTVLDAPARAIVQNTMMYNSRYGCNLCEIKSQLSVRKPGLKRIRIYNYIHNPILRTKDRMLKQAAKASEGVQEHVKGVKGPSVLSKIPSVDISKCIVPEYLHSVLIGVVKQVLHIWTIKKGNWSIKDKIFEIDAFLRTFKHPNFVHRSLRQLSSLKYWKASDFYYFLLFEALPTLHGHLSDQYLQHFTLLIKAIFTLLKSEITMSDVDEAELLLKLFVADFGTLYGDRNLTHNVHQLLHLCLCVRRYGPLFCFSAFPFEDLNGIIAKATHGTNFVDVEIVNNIKICQGIQILKNIVTGNHGLTVPISSAYCQGELLGKEVSSSILSSQEFDILQDTCAKVYSRAMIGYDVYTSAIHKPLNSQDFYVMWTDTNGIKKYGSIKYFAKSRCDDFIIIQLFTVDHTRVFYHERTLKCIEHFLPVEISNSYVAIRFSDIVSTIVKVGKINCYIYLRPNLYRFVM